MQNKYKTHNCGELREENISEVVRIAGWVDTIRDLGAMTFIDVRDQFGKTQVVFSEEKKSLLDKNIVTECTVSIEGTVKMRSSVNANIPTGKIEIEPNKIEVLGKCKNVLPFVIGEENNVKEDLRLEYRFLDLRNKKIHDNILFRAKVIKKLREKMDNEGFVEIQTPILANSSPEGARDYLVPSRIHPGKFYALPQAPQQFKQLLMTSGFDRYYQIAPCFRDEDPRADRAPGEFYQLDLEMAFATEEDVLTTMEKILAETFSELTTWKVDSTPFVKIRYEDAMLKYGIDKPDLRNPLIIKDLSELFIDSEFNAFKGKTIRAICIKNVKDKPRSFFDSMVEFAVKDCEAKGLSWLRINEDLSLTGSISKFINDEMKNKMLEIMEANSDDAIFFVGGEEREAAKLAGLIRIELGKRLELLEKEVYKFCFIVDYPMYELSDEGKIDFSHNPFSMPQGGMDDLINKDPLDIYAYQYDVVCNGYEISSGAVRNHDPETMVKAFEIAGYTREDVEKKFGALFNAFQYGAPPHAGMAPGVDRIVMLLKDEQNIREVIAFPKNGKALDLLMNAPSEVSEKQLKDVHIKLLNEEIK